jgi:hypothetical protein
MSQDRELVRDCYVGIDSIRRPWDLIVSHLAEWIACRLSFPSSKDDAWVEEQKTLWDTLGVDLESIEPLAATLPLHFSDGLICISTTSVDIPELIFLIQTIVEVLAYGQVDRVQVVGCWNQLQTLGGGVAKWPAGLGQLHH